MPSRTVLILKTPGLTAAEFLVVGSTAGEFVAESEVPEGGPA